MDFGAFKELVFEAISENAGQWTWYQLDRRLMGANPERRCHPPPCAHDGIAGLSR